MTPLRTDAGAAALRRALGPKPWCALEALLERSSHGHMAAASVLSIAAGLGVAKNTAHRAVAALVRAGVVEPVPERDAAGRFGAGRYRLHVADLLTAAAEATPTPTAPLLEHRCGTRRTAPRAAITACPELTMRTHVSDAHRTDQYDRQVPADGGRVPCCV
jgi:DNA-binding IscR family transcriptional regulator